MPLAAGQGEDGNDDADADGGGVADRVDAGEADDATVAVTEASTGGLSGRSVMGRVTDGEEVGFSMTQNPTKDFARSTRRAAGPKKSPLM
jgi:hypothetical protein